MIRCYSGVGSERAATCARGGFRCLQLVLQRAFLEDKKDAIYPTKFMENEDVILFRFMTNVYNDKQKTYNALYRKADGAVKVSPLDDKITDDTNGFLPLQPVSVSASGEFAAILPSEEVVSWFEDNAGETDIPAEVAVLKKVGEEDNPVVVIME